MRVIRSFAPALVLALVVAGCGGGDGGSTPPTAPPAPSAGSTSNAVNIADNSFAPSATTVPAGTTVTWTWTGSALHNVTFDDGPKSVSQQGGTYQRTFATAGSYPYHCTIHGAAMSGTVTVQ